jgi:hypothetical protein
MSEIQPLQEEPITPAVKSDDSPNDSSTSKRETRNLNILRAAGIESAKQNLIQRIFPAGRKATGIRRYLIGLTLLFLIDTLMWSFFFGLYNTNVTPVIGLQAVGAYIPKMCCVKASSIEKNNNIFFDVWRSELLVEYNDTAKVTPQAAKIYDSVTGVFGRESIAVDFLNSFPIGKVFQCHVKVSNKYFAAVKPENVHTNVILTLFVFGFFGVLFFIAMFRGAASFVRFRRHFIWDESREAWIVKSSNDL